MTFSTVAFAAEPQISIREVSDIQKYVSEMAGEVGIEPREPATLISRAAITDILQDTDIGRVYRNAGRRTCSTPAGAGRREKREDKVPKENRLGYCISGRGRTDKGYERKADRKGQCVFQM